LLRDISRLGLPHVDGARSAPLGALARPAGAPRAPVGAQPTRVYLAATDAQIEDLARRFDGDAPGTRSRLLLRPAASPRTVASRWLDLPLGSRPLIMGILNVTPDSFSDGGAFAEPGAAAERAWRLADEGADIVDIGGESTRPGSDPVPEAVEAARVLPVLEALGERFPIPISIDTYKAAVARRALEAGARIINDVTGLRADPRLAEVAAERGVPLVLSHIRGMPKTMQADPRYDDLMSEVVGDLARSVSLAVHSGVQREAIILDPGIGFGKSFDDNLEMLRRLPEISGLGHAVLVGVSRKSFLGRILDQPPSQRLPGSLAAAVKARDAGAAILRVHEVGETAQFFRTLAAIDSPLREPRF
jgi:dihydropteroate synthase